jgi:hypothetical protein
MKACAWRGCLKDETEGQKCSSLEVVILSFGAFEKVKLNEAWHLVEMTISQKPDLLEAGFGPLGYSEAVHGDEHLKSFFFSIGIKKGRYQLVQFPTLTNVKISLDTLLSHGASLSLRSIRPFHP